jgi:hypothetical protein
MSKGGAGRDRCAFGDLLLDPSFEGRMRNACIDDDADDSILLRDDLVV